MFPDSREAIIDQALAKDAAWAKEKGYDLKNLVRTIYFLLCATEVYLPFCILAY
jgi:hypothetical protein